MANEILVIVGIIMFGYSLFICVKLLKLVSSPTLKKWWYFLLLFIILFGIGYVIFAYLLISGKQTTNSKLLETIVSLVFFFGAIFVVSAIRLILSTVVSLKKENKRVREISKELEKAKKGVEGKIDARTQELKELNKSMIGRELKMIELKKKIEKLKEKIN